ncbi:class I SAM-dependent methyltransferase [Streptomyces sp. ST1015]|uniref:class I SAM-dependent methyltransferase n=1 Tax=Streptomyces sp. ST1015 TaxID=1848900 RepID=UPI0013A6F576|nr:MULTISPECIES: class I SAM-dependent methyltransferase [unclassified Streptomyces]QZZ28959.1 class I SAM-dependent methyltransferase [Streptomyces sp. ST1015]
MVDASINARAWNRIAAQDTTDAGAVPERIEWTCWPGRGPGVEFIGDPVGTRVAELGCGTGEHIAHVAAHGARFAVGIDVAEGRIARARLRFGHLPALLWRVGDAARELDGLPRLDVCFSIYGALWYADPDVLLPVVHHRLRPGGLLAFSVNGPRPGELPGRRVDNLSLTDGTRLPVVHYSYGADAWRRLLVEHGFGPPEILPVEGPEGSPYRTLVIRTRRSGD